MVGVSIIWESKIKSTSICWFEKNFKCWKFEDGFLILKVIFQGSLLKSSFFNRGAFCENWLNTCVWKSVPAESFRVIFQFLKIECANTWEFQKYLSPKFCWESFICWNEEKNLSGAEKYFKMSASEGYTWKMNNYGIALRNK